jgi:two-component system, OmpR family, response regulator ChvI
MSQFDARVGREYASVRSQDRLPATPLLSERERTFGFDQNDILSPARSAERAAIGKAELRRVILVENDQYYREVLTVELLRQGFVVHAFTDGASLLGSLATAGDADLVVLDWDLPKMPGIKLMAELRRHGVDLPVVFLTGEVIAVNEHDRCLLAPREALNADECMAFDQGAADFIAKSRDRQVLVRRLRRVVELAKPKTNVVVEERLTCDKLLLKPESSRAYWNEVDVDLTFGEYNIVHLLVSNAGSFVTYRAIYDRLTYEGFIAGTGGDGFRANVRSAIKRIRNKFRACDPAFDKIENYTGFGYCWRKPSL